MTILQSGLIFVRCLMSSFAYTTPSLPPPPPPPHLEPRRPLHMLYMDIATFNCPKGILGLGGKASKNKLKEASFIFSGPYDAQFQRCWVYMYKQFRWKDECMDGQTSQKKYASSTFSNLMANFTIFTRMRRSSTAKFCK